MHHVLDHIVILVPYETLQILPAWITDNFRVLNGGTHADGTTQNKLIVFQDGTYIELIAFVDGLDPNKRAQHRWGRHPEGRIIDWAFSLMADREEDGDPEFEFQRVQERVRIAQATIEYQDTVPGGRTTAAGKVLNWATSSPVVAEKFRSYQTKMSGGELPFWCLDRTPRSWRVPHDKPANVNHPSGVVGIAGITVMLRDYGPWPFGTGHPVELVYALIHNYYGKGVKEWELQAPVTSGSRGRRLRLVTFADSAAKEFCRQCLEQEGFCPEHLSTHVSIHLKFFTKGEARKISGKFVDGHELEFELVKVNE